MTFFLEIVTPEKVVFKEDVDEVVVPTTTGEIAILPNHQNLLSQVTSGELTIKKNGKDSFFAITGGFVEIDKNKVTILADYAVHSEDIEIEKAHEARKRAEKLMQEKVSEKDFALAEAEFKRSLLEIKVATRRKRKI